MGRRDNRSSSPKPAEPPAKKCRGEEQEQEQEQQKEVKVEEVQTDKEHQKEVQTDKAEQEVQRAGEQKEKKTDEEVQEEEQKEVQKEDQTEKELQGAEEQQEVQTDKEEQKEAQVPDVAVKDDVPEGSNEKQEVSSLPLSDITSCPQHNLRVSSHVLLLPQELKEAPASQAPPTQTRSGAPSLPPYDPSVPVGESHTGAPVQSCLNQFKLFGRPADVPVSPPGCRCGARQDGLLLPPLLPLLLQRGDGQEEPLQQQAALRQATGGPHPLRLSPTPHPRCCSPDVSCLWCCFRNIWKRSRAKRRRRRQAQRSRSPEGRRQPFFDFYYLIFII